MKLKLPKATLFLLGFVVLLGCKREFTYERPTAEQYQQVINGEKALVYLGSRGESRGTYDFLWRVTLVEDSIQSARWQDDSSSRKFPVYKLASQYSPLSWAHENGALPEKWISSVGGGYFVVSPGKYKLPEIGYWFQKYDYHMVRSDLPIGEVEINAGEVLDLGTVVVNQDNWTEDGHFALLSVLSERDLSGSMEKIGVPLELIEKLQSRPVQLNYRRVDYPESE
ncbi:hypothetical protein [Aestuariispira insulae]|uniref:Uncharacterized protein n=1 Tax=Aestuariispira insulae TaxID=1461337 RepID=A0A3D9HPG4_9PROT|nr:hypothetical protein [Aestuariispira insulae]RED51393.1 hypothetical protein DFP90_103193 [Aestuariispira insulae]